MSRLPRFDKVCLSGLLMMALGSFALACLSGCESRVPAEPVPRKCQKCCEVGK